VAETEVNSVEVVHFDPYEKKMEKEKATSIGQDHEFNYWKASLLPKYKRCRYGFHLLDKSEKVTKSITEGGVWKNKEIPNADAGLFCLPFVHKSDLNASPKWVKNTIWYQIFPERFGRAQTNRNHPKQEEIASWGSRQPSGATDFFGGNFEGVIEKIQYLKNLGINGVYFTPIFDAPSNHKYDTIDYMKIDAGFGDEKVFKEMVDLFHQNGIRVMLDAVFNHCGLGFAPFQDVLKNQQNSKYASWFHIRSWPVEVDPTLPPLPQSADESVYNYDRYAFERQMPKLRTENPEVREYLLNVAKYWIEKYDIDGWRLDVANEIEHEFWREFRKAVRTIKPDVFVLGEVWHDSLPWLMGDQFDSVMNYPFPGNAIDFVLGKMDADEFRKNMTRLMMAYPASVNQNLFNLIGSHDTERIINKLGFDENKLRMLLALEFTFVGTPCIYYGDEIGLDGEFDPGCRKCMPWETIDNPREASLLAFHRQMIKMRKEHSALFSSVLEFIDTPQALRQNLVAFVRRVDAAQRSEVVSGAEKIIVLMNNSQTKSLKVDLSDSVYGISRNSKFRHLYQPSSVATSQSPTILESGEPSSKRQRVARSRSLLISHEIGADQVNSDATLELAPYQVVILSEEAAATSAINAVSQTQQKIVA